MAGYNQEPNKEFTFTLTATPPAGADPGISQLRTDRFILQKGLRRQQYPFLLQITKRPLH